MGQGEAESDPTTRIDSRGLAVPVYSLPLAKAHFNCPRCETPVFFKAKPDNRQRSVNGAVCQCGTCGHTLGRYITRIGGIVWLEVIGRTPAIDASAFSS